MVKNQSLDQSDHPLIKALAEDGMLIDEIAKKFECTITTVGQSLKITDFGFTDNVLRKNIQLGVMKITVAGIEKRCAICNHFFPLTREHWHVKRSTKNGLREMSTCKGCETEKKARQEMDKALNSIHGKMIFSNKYLKQVDQNHAKSD